MIGAQRARPPRLQSYISELATLQPSRMRGCSPTHCVGGWRAFYSLCHLWRWLLRVCGSLMARHPRATLGPRPLWRHRTHPLRPKAPHYRLLIRPSRDEPRPSPRRDAPRRCHHHHQIVRGGSPLRLYRTRYGEAHNATPTAFCLGSMVGAPSYVLVSVCARICA